MCYRSTVAPRTGVWSPAAATCAPRTTVGLYRATLAPRTTVSGAYASSLAPRTRLFASPRFRKLFIEPSGSELVWKTRPRVRIWINDVELTSYLVALRISVPRNGKATWRGSFRQHQNRMALHQQDLIPPGFGALDGLVQGHNNSTDRLVTITVTLEQETFTFVGLPGPPSSNGRTLEWGGTDLTPLLEQEGQFMADILADGDGGVKRTAHQAMVEIAQAYGVEVRCDFPDFRIRELRRTSGSPLRWMDEIAKVVQATRRWDGEQLIYEASDFDPEDSRPDWTYIDRLNIKELSVLDQRDQVRNQFTVQRKEPQGSLLGEQECIGPQCVGRSGKIQLSSPTRNVLVTGDVDPFGDLRAVTAFDEADQVADFIATDLGTLIGANPIARVEFEYRPKIQGQPYTPRYYVKVEGGTTVPGEGPFHYVRQDDDSVADIGLQPEYSNLESPILFDGSTALLCVLAHLRESVLQRWRAQWETPTFNPRLKVGNTIAITDCLTRQDSRPWMVVQWDFDWLRQGARQYLTGVRPWL